jgi:hypothetical protein
MSPLTAIAIPAVTAAATQLVQEVIAQRPFRSFLAGDNSLADGPGLGVGDIASQVGQLMEDVHTAIANRLAAVGLDPASEFDLSIDAAGQLVVGDHPQRDAIAAALADDPSIRNNVAQISGLQHLLEAARRHLEFAKRYAIDPFTALPGEESPAPFALQFAGDALTLAE